MALLTPAAGGTACQSFLFEDREMFRTLLLRWRYLQYSLFNACSTFPSMASPAIFGSLGKLNKLSSAIGNFKRCFRLQQIYRQEVQVGPDNDQRTTVTILNDDDDTLMINSVSTLGFRLNNDLMVLGPIAIFPKTVLSWNVKTVEDINEDSLSLFCLLEPKIDILVIGKGDKQTQLSKETIKTLLSKKISLEILPTDEACTTFNFLNAEGRCVAGAMIPPSELKMTLNDRIESRRDRDKLFETTYEPGI